MAPEGKIEKGLVVSIDYKLTDDDGKLIDSSEGDEPLSYLHGHNQILPGLESALEGKVVGDTEKVHVAAGEGYGELDPEKVFAVPRDRFDFDVSVGQTLQAQMEDGQTVPFQVVELKEDSVILDGNHPLAGKALNFEVKVVAVRQATTEELDHGHAHEGDEHQH
jgi:FKBP-type peptidyl-prolyl cis-trans isomerase SlyD